MSESNPSVYSFVIKEHATGMDLADDEIDISEEIIIDAENSEDDKDWNGAATVGREVVIDDKGKEEESSEEGQLKQENIGVYEMSSQAPLSGHISLPQKAYAYGRVSTGKQASKRDGHVSLDVQSSMILQFAQKHGLEVKDSLTEAKSAYSTRDEKRGLWKLVKRIGGTRSQDACSLLVYDATRFSRNVEGAIKIFEICKKRHITLVFVNPTGTGTSLTIPPGGATGPILNLVKMAEQESRMIGRKVTEAKNRKRKMGFYVGGSLAYGKKSAPTEIDGVEGKKVVDDPHEIAVQRFMMYATTKKNITADTLNKMLAALLPDTKDIRVGARVCAYHDKHGAWYSATITNIYVSNETGELTIEVTYDDDEKENLSKEMVAPIRDILVKHPVKCYDDKGKEIKFMTETLCHEEISDLLVDYGIRRRGKAWTKTSVKNSLKPVKGKKFIFDQEDENDLVDILEKVSIKRSMSQVKRMRVDEDSDDYENSVENSEENSDSEIMIDDQPQPQQPPQYPPQPPQYPPPHGYPHQQYQGYPPPQYPPPPQGFPGQGYIPQQGHPGYATYQYGYMAQPQYPQGYPHGWGWPQQQPQPQPPQQPFDISQMSKEELEKELQKRK